MPFSDSTSPSSSSHESKLGLPERTRRGCRPVGRKGNVTKPERDTSEIQEIFCVARKPATSVSGFGIFRVKHEVVARIIDGQTLGSDLATDSRQRRLGRHGIILLLQLVQNERKLLLTRDRILEDQAANLGREGKKLRSRHGADRIPTWNRLWSHSAKCSEPIPFFAILNSCEEGNWPNKSTLLCTGTAG